MCGPNGIEHLQKGVVGGRNDTLDGKQLDLDWLGGLEAKR
jgi:hypothetical protein